MGAGEGSRRLRLSITVSGLGALYGDDLVAGLVETAQQAERAGLDQLVVTDHVAMGPRPDRYPYGPFPMPPEEPWPEPLTLLAALAGATRRIRLGTGILIAPLRPPVLLAKTLATLDVLSQGRLDCGVGVGWQPEEFEAVGVPFAERWARLDEAARVCRVLWRDAPARYEGRFVAFEDLWCLPRPVQPGGPPLWLGVAPTPRNLRRIAEWGDGWMPIGDDPARLADDVGRLREALHAAGRAPGEVAVRAHAPVVADAKGRPDLDATLARLPELAAAGVDVAAFALARFVRRRERIPAFLERLAARAPR